MILFCVQTVSTAVGAAHNLHPHNIVVVVIVVVHDDDNGQAVDFGQCYSL